MKFKVALNFMIWVGIVSLCAHAETILEISAPWDCPRTVDLDFPVEGGIKLFWDSKTNSLDTSELIAVLEKAEKEAPQYDFTSCAQETLEKGLSLLFEKLSKEREFVARYSQIYWSSLLKVSVFGARAYERGAVLPYFPGAAAVPLLSSEQMEEMLIQLGVLCGEQSLTLDYLDDRFLSYLSGLTPAQMGSLAICKQSVSRAYMQLLEDLNAQPCSSGTPICRDLKLSIQRSYARLAKLGLAPETAQALFSNECLPTLQALSQGARKLIEATSNAADCVELREGDGRHVGQHPDTGFPSGYFLKRGSDRFLSKEFRTAEGKVLGSGARVKSYEAKVNFQFMDAQAGNGNEVSRASKQMESRFTECFAQAAPMLRGPEGEFLEVKLVKGDAGGEIPPKSSIMILAYLPRVDSLHWSAGMDCSSVVHETLHHLGLVDEYREQFSGYVIDGKGEPRHSNSDGKKLDYDCRVTGPVDSVMNHEDEAYASAGLSKILGLFARTPKRPSLFYPSEFLAITQPGCPKGKPGFAACAREAYKNSRSAYGEGCASGLPAACREGTWLGRWK